MPSKQKNKDKNNKINRYILDEQLLKQGVSTIYLARDEKDDSSVFLVTLQPEAAKSSDLADRFLRRAETLAQLEHDAILPLLDFGMDGKRPYAVMPHSPGQFLAAQLESAEKPEPDDKAAVIDSLNIVKHISQILSVTHPTGLIHHDLRPENIYINESGQPLLLDLVVPSVPKSVSQQSGIPPAELDFESPEQLAGKPLSGRSNIFSLGVLLYRLLAGHKPALPVSEFNIFEHKGLAREVPLDKVRPDLTEQTLLVVQECLWQKEWNRFETTDALVIALERAIKDESAPPPPPPAIWRRAFAWLTQPQIRKFVIPAIVLFFLLILILFMMRGRANRQNNQNNNVESTGNEVVLPLDGEVNGDGDGETAVPAQSNSESTMTPASLDGDLDSNEVEVLPTVEETNTPTASPSPTNTAVPTQLPSPTQTASPEPTTQATETATNTATPEPTETSCVVSPPFGWIRYSIQPNDSLSSMAQATNTTVERLQDVNCLDTILLSVGQNIWLPFSPNPAPTDTPPPSEDATPLPPGNDPTPIPPGNDPPPPTSIPPASTPTVPPPNP